MRQRSSYPKPSKPRSSRMPATWSDDFQRSDPSRHQCQRDPQVATDLPASISCNLAGFRSGKSGTKTRTEEMVIISLPLGDKFITVKRPASDPDGCACFIRGLAQ